MLCEQDEEIQTLLHFRPMEILKNIPKPFFLTRLFLETPIAICRILPPPFDHFAITHTGEIFCRKPVFPLHLGDGIVTLNPEVVLFQDFTDDGRSIVSLQNNLLGIKQTFLVERLMLDRFWDVKLTEKLFTVEHLDGIDSNNHMNNLEAHYVDPTLIESCLQYTEEDHNN